MREKLIQSQVQGVLNAKNAPSRVFRNNVGGYHTADGGYIRYGLGVGSADLIGFVRRIITSDMIGMTLAQFLAVELKTPTGRLSVQQKAWLNLINTSGGLGMVMRSPAEAEDFLEEISHGK